MVEPRSEDITLFTRELSWMVAAGVPLGRAIDLMQAEAAPRMAPVLTALRQDLRAGTTLARAMEGTRAFPEAYLALVGLAEQAGTLPLVLERLHDTRIQAQALRRKIGQALVYPAFLLIVALGAVALIALTVIPQLRALLPPEPTPADAAIRRLVGLSDLIAAHGLPVALTLGAGVALAGWGLTRPPVAQRLADLCARLPGLGPLITTARLAALTRTLAMLTEAGLPLSDALRLTRRTLPPGALSRLVSAMEQALRSGGDVTAPLTEAHMPPLLTSLLRVGQETGNLGRSLGQAAQVFDEKTRVALDRALVLLEPLVILAISVGVGSLIYTVIGAMISVNDLFL